MRSFAEKLNKAKENKKGFTLVEIIVVLVIIGILASLMLGALNGYIDKAKEKTLTANTRSIYLAAQTVASEQYANGNASYSEFIRKTVLIEVENVLKKIRKEKRSSSCDKERI